MAVLVIAILIICLLIMVTDVIAFRKAELTVETENSVQARENASCHIRVRNRSIFPLIYKRLVFEVKNTYTDTVRKTPLRVNVLPKSTSDIDMKVELANCGKIRCEVRGRTFLMFGKRSSFCNFTILPELFATRIEYDLRESDIYDCETYSPYRKGQDYSEIYQIREYVPGDNIKHVHWKLSGRTDELMVKEASFPLDKSMMVVMDKGIPGDLESTDKKAKAAKGKTANEKKISKERSAAKAGITPDQCEALAALTVSVCRCLSDEGLDYKLVWNDPLADMCFAREIQMESELAESIPAILTGPLAISNKTCAEDYIQEFGPCQATHVIYLSCGVMAAEGRLFENARVTDIDARAKDYQSAYREIDLY